MKFNLLPLTAAVIIFVFSRYVCECNDSVATSISGMEMLLDTEKKILMIFEGYIKANEAKIEILKRKLEEYQIENDRAIIDPEKYVTNPLSSFSLIRRLASDWKDLMQYIEADAGESFLTQLKTYTTSSDFPTSEDVTEAVKGFIRIQSTYKLKPSDAMNGIINGVQYDHALHSKDLYEMGSDAFSQGFYYYADEWFKASLAKHDIEDSEYIYFNFNKETILEKAIDNKFAQKDYHVALKYTTQLLQHNDNNEKGITLFKDIEQILAFNALRNITNEGKVFGEPSTDPETESFERGCRGDYSKIRPRLSPEFSCHFVTENHPFLKIAPMKVEVINVEEPYMAIFHDIVSDKEIETLKTLAKPQLKRAFVYDPESKTSIASSHRTSKFAWYSDTDDDLFPILTQRLEDMTGLSMSTSEQFQVMNYGIGGHYATHKDYFDEPENLEGFKYTSYKIGNRIATMLFYISDVEQGGFTVFPSLLAAVKPKKGTCVFWYNLKPNGNGNPKTNHAACPVLVGSKWVFNKWIRSNGQMFAKPCPADYQ